MAFNFVVDRIVDGQAYPALAQHTARPYTPAWREFGQHWPGTVPCGLIEHCEIQRFPYRLYTITDNFPCGSYYPIALQFFDFSIDYIGLIAPAIMERIKQQDLKILFYYDEGDNPYQIKDRLDQQCEQHGLFKDSYQFISANTQAGLIKNFRYFPCDELLYWYRNRPIAPTSVHTEKRNRDFTVLSRVHKWWRATVMTDLHRQGVLDNSYWSYSNLDIGDKASDNPLELVSKILASDVDRFLAGVPYSCDDLTADQHNDHTHAEIEHFSNSYCNIVLETHFNAGGSNGAFLTEKTFKPIKHGQPFVIVGAVGSLDILRGLGYRTFDHAIDNSYDLELDDVQRWIKLVRAIQEIKQQDMHEWFLRCLPDILHNQQLFCQSKYYQLNMLHDKLLH